MMPRRALTLAAALLVAVSLQPRAWAGEPADQLFAGIDRVLQVLEDPTMKPEAKAAERRAAIRRIASDIFDIEEISRRTLDNARNQLRIKITKGGFQAANRWDLPLPQDDPEDSQDCGTAGLDMTSGSKPQEGPVAQSRTPPTRARARDEGETHSVDPESDEFDPKLYGPDGDPICRFRSGSLACLNESRCRNPRHRGRPDE